MAGRRRKSPTVLCRIYLPEHIYIKLQQFCSDETSKEKVYGRQSQLMTQLLTQFFAERENPNDLNTILGPDSGSQSLPGANQES